MTVRVSGGADKTLRLWDLEIGKPLTRLVGHGGNVSAVAALPDGRYALSGSWDGTLRLWDIETGEALRIFEGHSGPVLAVAAFQDGQRAISAGRDQQLRLWDLATGDQLATFVDDHTIMTCAVSGRSPLAVAGNTSGEIRVFDIRQGAVAKIRSRRVMV